MALNKCIQNRCVFTANCNDRAVCKDQTERNGRIDLLLMLYLTCRNIYQDQRIIIFQHDTGFLFFIQCGSHIFYVYIVLLRDRFHLPHGRCCHLDPTAFLKVLQSIQLAAFCFIYINHVSHLPHWFLFICTIPILTYPTLLLKLFYFQSLNATEKCTKIFKFIYPCMILCDILDIVSIISLTKNDSIF